MISISQVRKLKRSYQQEDGKPKPGFERHVIVLNECLRAMKLGYPETGIAYAQREGLLDAEGNPNT